MKLITYKEWAEAFGVSKRTLQRRKLCEAKLFYGPHKQKLFDEEEIMAACIKYGWLGEFESPNKTADFWLTQHFDSQQNSI